VILVDTGIGGPLDDFEAFPLVARSVEDALADHGLDVADVTGVITTHLRRDYFGHNAVFKHLPFYLQNAELERARKEEEAHLAEWFEFAGARFELLDEEAEVLPGVKVLPTPGHTIGHQSILVEGSAPCLLVGDAAFNQEIWGSGDSFSPDHPSFAGQVQTGDFDMWRDSLARLRSFEVETVHFCHDSHIIGREGPGQPPLRSSGKADSSGTAWGDGGAPTSSGK
jgi:N-acyl homoserine lactone hydrolase